MRECCAAAAALLAGPDQITVKIGIRMTLEGNRNREFDVKVTVLHCESHLIAEVLREDTRGPLPFLFVRGPVRAVDEVQT
jgi:hypothetical protein